MKKTWLLLILTVLFLTGCSEPGWNGYEKLDIPRSLRCEYFFSPNVGTDTIKTGTIVIGEFSQVTDFFNPWKRPIDRFEQIPDWKIQIVDMDAPRYSYRIKILDIECYSTDQIISPGRDWRFPVTSYHVQILRDESNDCEINKDAYITLNGAHMYPIYGYPRLAVGGEYLIADAYEPYLTCWRDYSADYAYKPSYLFEIHEIDGTEYLYPFDCDISTLDFKMEITDPEENAIYKQYRDWDILKVLNEYGYVNPTFDYKVKLTDFVEYRDTYNAKWNEDHKDSELVTDERKLSQIGILDSWTRIDVNPRNADNTGSVPRDEYCQR
ncbi:MAG: hypothetical protein IKY52_01785 [Clostridia bacterium]|nr:hypothetical protein [Clostridia bacterium]